MRHDRSLRHLLMMNAILAAGLIWTLLVATGPFAVTADAAQYRSTRASGPPAEALTGVGNASARQRKQMIDRLTEIETKVDEIARALTSGAVKVKIANVEDLAIDYGRLAEIIQSRK
jgi:hypothetical protein